MRRKDWKGEKKKNGEKEGMTVEEQKSVKVLEVPFVLIRLVA